MNICGWFCFTCHEAHFDQLKFENSPIQKSSLNIPIQISSAGELKRRLSGYEMKWSRLLVFAAGLCSSLHAQEVEAQGPTENDKKYDALLVEKMDLSTKYDQALVRIDETDKQVDELNKQNKAMKEELNTLITTKATIEHELKTVNTRVEEKNTELEKLKRAQQTHHEASAVKKQEFQDKYDKLEATSKIIQDHLSKEIAKTLKAVEAETKLTEKLRETEVLLRESNLERDNLRYDYDKMKKNYDEAVEHLAHPQLYEYLVAQGRTLGEMRPELQAALQKAHSVMEPHVNRAWESGAMMYNQTHERLRSNVEPYVGQDKAQPVTVGVLLLFVMVPAFIVYRFITGLRKALMLSHWMLCLNFWGMCFFIAVFAYSGSESQDVFQVAQKQNPVAYSIMQLIMGVFFILHILGTFCLARASSKQESSCTKYVGLLHFIATVGVVYHYYTVIWAKAMLDQEHNVSNLAYLGYGLFYLSGTHNSYVLSNTKYSLVHISPNVEKRI